MFGYTTFIGITNNGTTLATVAGLAVVKEGQRMSRQYTFWTLGLMISMSLTLSSCSSINMQESTTTTEQDAGPVPFQKIVEFDRAVHFLTPEGQDIVLPPGGYTVEVVQESLQLKSADKEDAEAVVIQAQASTHQESVEAPELVKISGGEDQQVVMMVMPGGKALQAIGTFSGVQPRGLQLQAAPTNRPVLHYIPQLTGIFTVPQLGALSPGGTLYVKGTHLGSSKGKITLKLVKPIPHNIDLSIEEWNDDKIKATVPYGISGVMDHPATFQLRTSTGVVSSAWQVPFYATRSTKWLAANDPAVKVVHCSTGGDKNRCNGLNTSTGGSCFSTGLPPVFLNSTLYAQHVNCDLVGDWDEGKDRYDVTLKNGWVFAKVEYFHDQSSSSEKIHAPDYYNLRQGLPGATSWKPEIGFEVSPGPDHLEYAYRLLITGPKGVPHY